MSKFPKLIECIDEHGLWKTYTMSDLKIGGHDFISTGFEVPQYGWTCRTCNYTVTNYSFLNNGIRDGKLSEESVYIYDEFADCHKVVVQKNHNWQIVEGTEINKYLIDTQLYHCNKCLYYKKVNDKIMYSSDGTHWPGQWDFSHDMWKNFINLTCEEVIIKKLLE